MAERLIRIAVPEGHQTIRLEWPDGRVFRIATRDDGVVRFVTEGIDTAEITAFYVHPAKAQAIVGVRATYPGAAAAP